MARDAGLHRCAHRRHPRRDLAGRTRSRVHPRPGRQARTRAHARRYPRDPRLSWRPGDLPRAGPDRGLPAPRPETAEGGRARIRPPHRAGRHRHARRLEHRRRAARGRARRLRGRGQGRRPRHPRPPRLHLPWPGLQHRDGPRALPPDQPVRLCGAGGDLDERPRRAFEPGCGETAAARPPRRTIRPPPAPRRRPPARRPHGPMSESNTKAIPLTVVGDTAASLTPGEKQLAGDKIARSPVQFADAPVLRKPSWIRVRIPSGNAVQQLKAKLRENRLVTVCEDASCPNIHECFSHGTATFMILGDVCTRRCSFCDVAHGRPKPADAGEPERLARTVADMGLKYVVITSVDRDDLRDGGAGHFVDCIRKTRELSPATTIEVLVPDFRGRDDRALEILKAAPPDVMNHNLETIPRLYKEARPGSDYAFSLNLLKRFKEFAPDVPTKSGIMVGLGETDDEILQVMRDMRAHGIDMLTIGQYLAPSTSHLPVRRYVHPDTFKMFEE